MENVGTDRENSWLTGSLTGVLVICIRTKAVDHPLGVEPFHILRHLHRQLFPAAATVRQQLATHSVHTVCAGCKYGNGAGISV